MKENLLFLTVATKGNQRNRLEDAYRKVHRIELEGKIILEWMNHECREKRLKKEKKQREINDFEAGTVTQCFERNRISIRRNDIDLSERSRATHRQTDTLHY